MKLKMLFGAVLVSGVASGSLLPGVVPGSEIEGGMVNLFARKSCTSNNCLRQVTGAEGKAKPAKAVRMADCSSFMQTVVFSATTVQNSIPTYASTACSVASRYSSACSCWGITATTVTVQPTTMTTTQSSTTESVQPTATIITITGKLRVDVDGVSQGYLQPDPSYWTPQITPDIGSALVVSFDILAGATSAISVEFKATGLQGGFPFLGFVSGRESTSSDAAVGSLNYFYIDPTSHTPAGSTPQSVPSYFSSSASLDKQSESSVWTVDYLGTGHVTPIWINTDGNAASNFQIFIQSNHLYAGSDPEAFHSRFPAPVTPAYLTFIPI